MANAPAGNFDEHHSAPIDTGLAADSTDRENAPGKDDSVSNRPDSWIARARELRLQGPTDLSVRLHEYLYGDLGNDGE